MTLLLSERDGNERKIQKLHKTSSFCTVLTCAIPVLVLIISAEASALYCSISLSLSHKNLVVYAGISNNLCNFTDKNSEADGERGLTSNVQISYTVHLKNKHEL